MRQVAHADDLGAGAGAGDQGLHLLGRQILRLVDHHVLVQEGAPAHEVHALDLDLAADQLVGGRAAPFACAGLGFSQHFQVVIQRTHPGAHFFFLGPRQEANVFANTHGGAGHNDFAVTAVVQHLGQARCQGQQGFASARGAGEGDEIDLGVHEQVQREILLTVARGHAPDGVFEVVEFLEGFQDRGLAANLGHARIKAGLAGRFKIHKLVDVQARHDGAADAVESVAAALPAFHRLAMPNPEVRGQGQGAGIQQVAVFQGLVVLIVFCGQSQRPCLHAHVDVFGHQHHITRRVLLAQGLDHAQNLVVGLALGQAHGQAHVQGLRLEKQLATHIAVAGAVQRQAFGHVGALGAGQRIQRAAGLACVACHLGHAFFIAVQLFQHDHGQEDVMFLKAEQAHGVVHQYIGIEHEKLGGALRLFGLGRLGACGRRLGLHRGRALTCLAAGAGRARGHHIVLHHAAGRAVEQVQGLRLVWHGAFSQMPAGLSARFGRDRCVKGLVGQQGCALGRGGGKGHGERAYVNRKRKSRQEARAAFRGSACSARVNSMKSS